MLSHYTGGVHGWGTMVTECEHCHEIVAEYECDDVGRPIRAIFDRSEEHVCDIPDDDEGWVTVDND
jgi:hypothetical protein